MTTTNDLSTPEPVVKWSEAWWANAKPEVRAHRCKAHRKNGDRCKRAAIDGANVCPQHGGRAPQVRAKAQRRLAEATDHMARELLKMATNDNVADAVKLTAIRDALDRGGVAAKTAVEVDVSDKPFEKILESMDSGSRADFRRNLGIEGSEEPPQIAPVDNLRADDDDDLIVEGQVLDNDYDDGIEVFDGDGEPISADDWEHGSDDDSEAGISVFGPSGPPPGHGMVPLSEAVAQAAEARKHATLRPIQRALPRGRSQ